MLKQLVAYLGRDQLLRRVRAYFAEHGWGNATLSDLLRALEASSGRALGDWSKAVAGDGRAEHAAAASSRRTADGAFTEFAVLQEAPAEHPTLRPHHIAIGLYNRPDGRAGTHAPGRGGRDRAADRGARAGRAAAARPDPAQRRRPRLRDRPVRRAVAGHADRVDRAFTDSLARTVCWSAVIDMAQRGRAVRSRVRARSWSRGMGKEPSVSVLQTLQ